MTSLNRVAVESSEIIKPASPTPRHLERYNLSSRDINTPNYYMPLLLFYSGSALTADHSLISNELKRSLSQTLAKYYPFAGRLRSSEVFVDCRDQGVEFLEARVKCKLDELIHADKDYEDEYDRVAHLFPPDSVWGEPRNNSSSDSGGPLMIVQLNRFECGGMAMAVDLSHRITDGGGLVSFLKNWAAVSRQSGAQVDDPRIVSWPTQNNVDVLSTTLYLNRSRRNWITKRFVFQNSSLARLKKTVASHGLENPTRVELVSSLLYKTAVNTVSSTFSPSILLQIANLRANFALPEIAVGNFYWPFTVEAKEQGDLELHKLIKRIKDGKMQLRNKEVKDLDGERLKLEVFDYMNRNCGLYICTSLCNFPVNNMDFGWGEPIKVCSPDGECMNEFVLMDTPRRDGIEAIVCLAEEHMSKFQCDQHILTFAASAASAAHDDDTT